MQGKDEKSFEALALPHLPALYRIARRLSRRDAEAEDLVQETFLRAYRAFGSFEVRSFGIRPWLIKILNNAFLNRQAKGRREPRAADPSALEDAKTVEATIPPDLDLEDVDQEVKAAIDQLAPEFRSVLLLWATMEMSYQEIADTLDVPIGTVMSRLHRARHQVTQYLESYARASGLARSQSTK